MAPPSWALKLAGGGAKKAAPKKAKVMKTVAKPKVMKSVAKPKVMKVAAKPTAMKASASSAPMKGKAEGTVGLPAKKGKAKVDASVPGASGFSVVGDFNAKLNQTDVATNHNKYYFIQLLTKGGKHFVWTRWGRVGYAADAKTNMAGPMNQAAAEKAFQKKFSEKTKNQWDKRGSFVGKKGKYTLIDVEEGGDEGKGKKGKSAKEKKAASGKTSLNKDLAGVLRVIFDRDMFKAEMAKKKVDVGKLPLGQLTKAQIGKGNAILSKLQEEIEKPKKKAGVLASLSSDFYTLIPHNFGFKKPPSIDSTGIWNEKVDLLNTLNDIQLAQQMQGTGGDPLSESYKKLNNKMDLLPGSAKEHKAVSKYFQSTKRGSSSLIKVFSLQRAGEKSRMSPHAKVGNRRLLWHGTSPAVVAAVLSGGLRIMPHSGGRVGKGIYLASEQSKSAGYTGTTKVEGKNTGFMFLVEAALGKSSIVEKNHHSFKAAPKGYQSVLAAGRTESFDPSKDTTISGPYGPVAVPQAAPKKTKATKSDFSQSEYLVYKESQTLLRYLCLVKMH